MLGQLKMAGQVTILDFQLTEVLNHYQHSILFVKVRFLQMIMRLM